MGLLVVLVMIFLVLVVGAAMWLFSLATMALRNPMTKRHPKTDAGAREDDRVAAG